MIAQISHFDDFCTWAYVIIDDYYQRIARYLRRPGPAPLCSDSELITLAIVGECRGWDVETNLLHAWQAYRDLFPHLPERSRFNRRRRNLAQAINVLRRLILAELDAAQDRQTVLDSLPVPVIQFHLAPSGSRHWAAYEAAYGTISSKKLPIYGYKLHVLMTLGGVILDYILAPANAPEAGVGLELLTAHTDRFVIADKGYLNDAYAAELWASNRVRLLTQRRRNQKRQLPPELRQDLNRVRQIVETVFDQLDEQMHIETNHAHSFYGLCSRLHTKLLAHTLCVYLNRLLGAADFLHIKRLAFPAVI